MREKDFSFIQSEKKIFGSGPLVLQGNPDGS